MQNKTNKQLVENIFNQLAKYETKLGANDIAYQMQLDMIKSQVKDEVEIQECTEYLVDLLQKNNLWKISRVSFNTKEIYKTKLISFHNQLVKEGVLVKDKTRTNRFLLVNENTKEYFNVSSNISKTSIPKEVTRHEMVKDEKVSKKEVKESLAK